MFKYQARAKEGQEVFVWGGKGLTEVPNITSQHPPLLCIRIPAEGEPVNVHITDGNSSKNIGKLLASECLSLPLNSGETGIFVTCRHDTLIECEMLY